MLPAIVSASVWALTEEGAKAALGDPDNESPSCPVQR